MNEFPPLEDVFPPWKSIYDKYDSLFLQIGKTIDDPRIRMEKEESLAWEHWAFELIVTFLLHRRIPFDIQPDDVQPIVKDINGIDVEIDFRITVHETQLYFGVTRFYDSVKDLKKDVEQVDLDIYDVKKNGIPILQHGKITSVRSHNDYMNRRMCVRVAKEGKHHFDNDYIYIFFPRTPLGLDGISHDFTIDTNTKYFYKTTGINAIIVIAIFAEKTAKHAFIHDNKLLLRTFLFNTCSELGKYVLASFDHCTCDFSRRSEQAKRLLGQQEGSHQNR